MNTTMISAQFGVDELDADSMTSVQGGGDLWGELGKALIGYLIDHSDAVLKGVSEGWNAT